MRKHTHEFVKRQYEKFGYKLKSEYKNCHIKDLVECIEGHQYETTYHKFQQGRRCPICGNQNHTHEFVKRQYEKFGYKLKSEYKNVRTKDLIQCSKGHEYKITYHSFKQGKRCPICWELKSYSRIEKDCLDVVQQLTNENIIENDRIQIVNPKTNWNLELDIYIPSLNKAVEFNGEYWHNNDYVKYKDNQKIEQCKSKNIDLMVIEERDWIENKEEQIEKLKEFLNEES